MSITHGALAAHNSRELQNVVVAFMIFTVLGITSAQGTWSTANLSTPRSVTGTSVGSFVIFAGGISSNALRNFDNKFVQDLFPMQWMCTIMQQEHGRPLSSVWRDGILQLHQLETWPCSLGVNL
jgi:hypothetical protein